MNRLSLGNIKALFQQYESYLSACTLILGFAFDYLTLHRVDYFLDNVFVMSYLVIAGVCITIMNLYEEGKLRNRFFEGIIDFLPFVLQFAFGGLFSAFTIFYSKSASLFSSGAFVLILFVLLVGNEFFKKRYEKLVFQVTLYFTSIFFFFIYFLPVLIKKMGAWVFLGSGAVSLMLIAVFAYILSRYSPLRYEEERRILIFSVLSLFVFINVLYFTNIIPPIPLSIKSQDVYHFVEKQADGSYVGIEEKDNRWYRSLTREVVHLKPDEPAYVFSSVFAPTDLNTQIIHDWQYYDETKGEWVSASKIPFMIIGGRNNGFRAFSMKDNIFQGKWRVDVETDRGQVIGRLRFDVKIGEPPFGLESHRL